MKRASPALASLLLAAALIPAAALAETVPQVSSTAYRLDLGTMGPGEAAQGRFTLTNHGPGTAWVTFLQEGSPVLARLPEPVLVLEEGASRAVAFRYQTPSDARPGNHEESIKLLVGAQPPGPAGAGGSLVAGTAILLRSRTAAAGVHAIEGPASIMPGDPVEGRVLVLNTANATADLTVRLALVDANGTPHREAFLGPVAVSPGGSAALAYAWNDTTGVPSGASALEATLVPPPDGNVSGVPLASGAFRLPLSVGLREVRHAVVSLRDNGDGSVSAQVRLENTGTVPVLFTPKLRFRSLDGAGSAFEADLPAVLLQPGETRLLDASLALPPGRYGIGLDGPESASFLKAGAGAAFATGADADAFLMRPPREDAPLQTGLLAAGVALAGLAALVALVLLLRARRRPTARAEPRAEPRARRVPVALVRAPPAAAPDALDAFLASLEREESGADAPARRIPVHAPPAPTRASGSTLALLVDPERLFGPPGAPHTGATLDGLPALAAQGRRVAEARAYLATEGEDDAHARQLAARLRRAGYEPHLHEDRHALRIRIALDAVAAARRGHAVVLATHDPALAEAARHLRDEGHRCEVLGIEGHLPDRLAAAADAVHLLPAHTARPTKS